MSHIWKPRKGRLRLVEAATPPAPAVAAEDTKDQVDSIASSPNRRIAWLDAVKGLGIILVVIGHAAPLEDKLVKVIFSFHMPLFFIISGYRFGFAKYRDDFPGLLKSRAKSLLYPYFVSGLVFFLIWLVFQSQKPFADISFGAVGGVFYDHLLTWLQGLGLVNIFKPLAFINPVGASWFILALFCTQILFYLFLKTARALKPAISLVILIAVAALGLYVGKRIFLPWNIDIALVSMLLMFCGYVARQNRYLERLSAWWSLALLGVWLVCLKYSFLSMNDRVYQRWPLAILGSIAATFFLLVVVRRFIKLDGRFGFIWRGLCFIGERTLVILIVHATLIAWVPTTSLIRYHWALLATYAIVVSLVIAEVIRAVPFLNKVLCLGGNRAI
jgi:fucose 4-O-acetylase-like acetyltransferase